MPCNTQSWDIARVMPTLTGKVAIVTGGNTGLGRELVKHLSSHGAKVYMASRNRSKAEAAIAELEKETGKRAIFLELDLADLSSVKKAVETFQTYVCLYLYWVNPYNLDVIARRTSYTFCSIMGEI